ncbi:MAG: TRAM domain-containing protein, partial [Candidatus Nezhaarchaeales archaeon]
RTMPNCPILGPQNARARVRRASMSHAARVEAVCRARSNADYVGKEVDVLLTDVAPRGGLLGRMVDYRPVVIECDHNLLWRKVTVIIEEAKPHVLLGRMV